MEEKIKELKEKFEGSNKYMLTLSYEDIKELFAIIEVLKNKEPTFLIKDLNNPKLKEVTLQDAKGLIEQGREEVKDKIKAKIQECREILYSFEKELELKANKEKYIHKESMNCLLSQISILQSLL